MKEILLVPHHHFDPTWRRCFDRPAVHHGVTVRSYAEVEAHCFNAWLALVPRGYSFSEGQAVVLRKYLERHPERKAELQQLARLGQFNVLLAGETVQDTVLSSAEGLVRNFLVARSFYQDLVGESYPGLKLASAEDAFGNSPNYPQVLRGVGAEVVLWPSYRPVNDHVWVGIDGSKIAVYDSHPSGFAGGFAKHAPCPECRGTGCAACRQTGLRFVDGFDLAGLQKGIEDAMARNPDSDWVAIRFLTEEILPDARVADFVEAWNREHAGQSQIRFANPLDVWQRHRPTVEKAVAERDEQPSPDLNPAMPGCMVSHIRNKQRTRALAYHLVAAEAALANTAWKNAAPARPPTDLSEAWRQVAFNQFHDAITGTHIDSANVELMDLLDAAEAVAQKHLPRRPRRPAVGKLIAVTEPTAPRPLGRLDVTFDRCGLLKILTGGRDLFGSPSAGWNNRRRGCRIGELALEPDYGDAWGTRIAPGVAGPTDFSVVLLGDYHTSVEASDRAIRWKGHYDGGDWKVKMLRWTMTVTASRDGRRLEFRTEVNWDTGSRRLRVYVPVDATDPMATYEVPFGFIDRTFDASQFDFSQWNGNALEFPTLHWIRKAVDERSGVALLNKGLPCNRWMPGRLDLSLVRSPEWAFCSVEPGSYEFWDTTGQRDPGRHVFEYALWPYTDGLSFGDLTRAGYEYNQLAPVKPPFKLTGDVVITAWKLAESGEGWILRLQEAGGQGTKVVLSFDRERQVTRTDLLERPQSGASAGKVFESPLHKHGILTLLIR